MNGIEHAIQFLSNDHHFAPAPGNKAEAQEILTKLLRDFPQYKSEPDVIDYDEEDNPHLDSEGRTFRAMQGGTDGG